MQSISIPRAASPRSTIAWQKLRFIPWLLAATISTALAYRAPNGRKPFEVDWALTLQAIEFSLVKGPHIGAAAVVGLLAVIATGRRRLVAAFALTVLVGLAWEVAQTTVLGHNARLSDLLPDAVGAVFGCAWGAVVLWLLESHARDDAGPRR